MDQTPSRHSAQTVQEAIMAIQDADAAKASTVKHKKQKSAKSLRERLRSNSRFGYGVAVAVLITGVALLAMQWVNQFGRPAYSELKVFYSVDDGKTYFPDGEGKLPPFDHPNGLAVRAHVFNGSSGPFVGYLERFSPEARNIITRVSEAAKTAKPGDKPPPELANVVDAQRNGRQVKRPKDANWVSINSGAGQAITRVKISGNPELVKEIQPK
jgi:hypothetical protein